MIVLEGPDGGGKTSLLEHLLETFPQVVAGPRASDSVGGPTKDLKQWVDDDMMSWTDGLVRIYDRYPLISEPIYGPICRGRLPATWNPRWIRQRVSQFRRMALVIFCLPSLETCRQNALKEPTGQMAGVMDNFNAIYAGYTWISCTYVGRSMTYIYNLPGGDDSELHARIYDQIRSWNG